jgi:hypothetical protein
MGIESRRSESQATCQGTWDTIEIYEGTMENKIKHLEFIQSTVGRMASNLFLLKGWTITLIAAVFAVGRAG